MAAPAAPAALNPITVLPPAVNFPMDLSGYGIFNPAGGPIITNIDELKESKIYHIDPGFHTLEEVIVLDTYYIIDGSTFTLNGLLHTVGATTGNKSSFGIGYLVERTNSDGTITKMFLKAFKNEVYDPDSELSKSNKYEGITQAIIHKTTAKPPVDHEDCEYTPKCYLFTADPKQITEDGVDSGNTVHELFILQENYGNLGITLTDFIRTSALPDGGVLPIYTAARLESILVKLARKLYVLYELYDFNHGDLHSSNIFVVLQTDGTWSPRLIDYGFSLITIPPTYYDFGANGASITRINPARNLIHLASYLRYTANATHRVITPIETFMLSEAEYDMLRLLNPKHRADWAVNPYFNLAINDDKMPTGTPTYVLYGFKELSLPECSPLHGGERKKRSKKRKQYKCKTRKGTSRGGQSPPL